MRLVLAGLLSDDNLGDRVIYDCVRFLCEMEARDALKNAQLQGLDLQGLTLKRNKRPLVSKKILGLNRRIKRLLAKNEYTVELRELKRFYRRRLSGADGVIVVGGGLVKYRYQKCWLYLSALITVADEHHVPVCLNAVGVEGYDSFDFRALLLRDNLNKAVVKRITTRDDVNCLAGSYLVGNKRISCEKVADAAVWADKVYNVCSDESASYIGVGLIRGGIFADNNVEFTRDQLVSFYVQLLDELDKRSTPWRLFTNGLPGDSELAAEILSGLNAPRPTNEVLVPRSAKELATIIASFKGIIAARLHANIIAYSMRIPSVGLVWNDKLSAFGRQIKHPERFVSCEQFDASYVVDVLMKAIEEGHDLELLDRHKDSARSSVFSMLEALGVLSK